MLSMLLYQNIKSDVTMMEFRSLLFIILYAVQSTKVSLFHSPEDSITNGLLDITCEAYGNPVPDITIYCDTSLTILSTDMKVITDASSFGALPMINQTVYVNGSEANGIRKCYCNSTAEGVPTGDDTVTVSKEILPGMTNI